MSPNQIDPRRDSALASMGFRFLLTCEGETDGTTGGKGDGHEANHPERVLPGCEVHTSFQFLIV